MFRFKNVSPVALQVPELGIAIPKDGYSSPMPSGTPTLDAYVTGQLMVKETLNISEVSGTGPGAIPPVQAIVQGGAPIETNTAGPANAIHAGPGQPGLKLDYTPPRMSSKEEKSKNYDNQAGVKNAIENTVISIGSDPVNFNSNGEIPDDEARRLVRSAGSSSFSTEVSGGQYIADEAQKIIASASGITAKPKVAADYKLPENLPAELAPFFQQTGLQKKIFIYKTTNAEVLHKVQGFEKDANVLSCIDQRLAELGK
jgi:hypothetical protein